MSSVTSIGSSTIGAAPLSPYPHLAVPGWGNSGLVNNDWVPPSSLMGTPNTPRDIANIGLALLVMTAAWLAFTFALRKWLSAKHSDAYIGRIVSLVHAGLSTLYCAYTMFLRFRQFNASSEYVTKMCCLPEPPLADEQFAALFTASYFLCDTISLVTGDSFDMLFLFHHIGALVILGTALVGRIMGMEVAVGIVILECTNVQLHGRWLLSEHKYDEINPASWLWWLCDEGFLVMFFVARMIIGTTAALSFLLCPTAPIHISFVTFIFLVCSGKFLVDCVRKIRKGEKWVA